MGTDELSIWMTDGLGKEFRCCFIIITSFNLFKFEGNAKNCQHNSQGQGHKIWPRGQGLASRTTSLIIWLCLSACLRSSNASLCKLNYYFLNKKNRDLLHSIIPDGIELFLSSPEVFVTFKLCWISSHHHHHHHHHRVACPSVSIAVSTSWHHFEQSCTRYTMLRPRLWGWRLSSIVRSQSSGGWLMAARRMREWSCDGSALARCPNRRSRLFAITEVTGGWPVLRLAASLVKCAVYRICTIRRRHHWSNA